MFGAGQTSVPVEDRSKPPWCWPGMQALLSTNDFAGFIRSEFLESEQGALPQARSLTDQSGELLVDFVGKVESISDDWQKLCTRLGVQAELPHVNRSEKRFEDVREYWTDDDLDFVAKKYREDFELFGYQLDETL